MGSYKQTLTDDMKAAMKAGDKARLQVIRSVIAAIKGRQDELSKDELGDDEELAILQKAVKTRRDAIEQAKAAGRQDIVDAESAEVEVIQGYLPEMLTGDALLEKVRAVAAEVGYAGPADKGKFMKAWMSQYKGMADGRDVQSALGQL